MSNRKSQREIKTYINNFRLQIAKYPKRDDLSGHKHIPNLISSLTIVNLSHYLTIIAFIVFILLRVNIHDLSYDSHDRINIFVPSS